MVEPEAHGVIESWVPQANPDSGLIDVLHKAGIGTASFFTWEWLRDLSRPGSLDMSVFVNDYKRPEGDHRIADDYASLWR